MAHASHRHMMLLHRLQQRRLRARAGAVDLVGHQQLGEDRPLDEAEAARAVEPFLHHLGAENVGGHQVGRELHAQRVEPHDDAERLHQLGLGEAGNADQQAVTAGQQGDERLLDDPLLAEDHRADRLARGGDAGERRFGGLDDAGVEFGDGHRVSSACRDRRARPGAAAERREFPFGGVPH